MLINVWTIQHIQIKMKKRKSIMFQFKYLMSPPPFVHYLQCGSLCSSHHKKEEEETEERTFLHVYSCNRKSRKPVSVHSITLSRDNCSGVTLCILCAANRQSETTGWVGREAPAVVPAAGWAFCRLSCSVWQAASVLEPLMASDVSRSGTRVALIPVWHRW